MKQSEDIYNRIQQITPVSRETMDNLICYHDLLIKWQTKINLISPKTIPDIWERHFFDSAQLFQLLSCKDKSIFDIGSGAGFPGLVLSMLGASQINLFESDQRKCIFLSEVVRQTKTSAKIYNKRIERIPSMKEAAVVTSRACASLDMLFDYAYPHLAPDGQCLFLKGRGAEEEISVAQRRWMFHVEHTPSITDAEGCVLQIKDLRPR
ncbi:MAG: 16S rRNA (guanine(527)-N(7))-methyltransferase RsmG [Alphaproteobacteria bacterium]|nr:16S rRNA (guanine(527)-N(7))-methyltransferase RsmG [Alphaproteobacteria bacterium]